MVAVVEDDIAMRRSIERLLQASGFDTTTFECGQEFLNSDTAKTTDALVLGCAGYLHKPFEAHQLTEALQRGLMT